jgi:hypothetical protein
VLFFPIHGFVLVWGKRGVRREEKRREEKRREEKRREEKRREEKRREEKRGVVFCAL